MKGVGEDGKKWVSGDGWIRGGIQGAFSSGLHNKTQHKKHKKADLFSREGRDACLPQVLIVPPRWLI